MPDILLRRPLLCLGIGDEQQLRNIASSDGNEIVGVSNTVPVSGDSFEDECDSESLLVGVFDQAEVRQALSEAIDDAASANAAPPFLEGISSILTLTFSE
jgi:hypothetical protein